MTSNYVFRERQRSIVTLELIIRLEGYYGAINYEHYSRSIVSVSVLMIRAAEKRAIGFACLLHSERKVANEAERYLFQIRFSRSLDSLKVIG